MDIGLSLALLPDSFSNGKPSVVFDETPYSSPKIFLVGSAHLKYLPPCVFANSIFKSSH